MVEVMLRDYCEEIEGLIDQGAFDAAISHCQHILKAYPKYLKAYSIIGKTALEKGDLDAAADLFSRVLSIDPEDFVARVGMSIASDKDGALDQAIWHMERAFELAPDNQAIVGELRRLYARRDGVEPEKVNLTQGALARLHARGNLYAQATNELNRLLQDNPNRVDLQVALAETLWRADRRIEAAETSLAILEKLPYCLKANLILGEIWTSSGREREGDVHLDRARLIDPENETAQEVFGARSPLRPAAAKIERMDYIAPPVPEEQEPDWLQTLIEEGAAPPVADEAVPEWLKEVAASVGDEVADQIDADAVEAEQVPDWLQDAAATADLEAVDFVSTPEIPAVSESEMPDWLAEMTAASEVAEGEPLTPEDIPEWLDEAPVASDEEVELVEDELPDWLTELESSVEASLEEKSIEAGLVGAAAAAAAAARKDEEVDEEVSEGIPDWLAEIESPEAPVSEDEFGADEEPEMAPGEIPDWLAEMAPAEVGETEEGEADIEHSDVEEPQVAGGEKPDWLAELASAGGEEADEVGLAPAEIPDWLADMAPSGETASLETEAPSVSELDVEAAEVPDWLVKDAAAEETLEEDLAEEESAAEPSTLVEADTPDWLSELVTAATLTMETEAEPAEDPTMLEGAELPDWLTEESLAEVEEAGAEADLMALMEDMSPEEAFAAWEAMLAESEVLEEEAVESEEAAVPAEEEAIAETEELPDWLIEEASTEVEEAETEADLMARMEDMSPEEAFAAWEAMLAESEVLEEEAVTSEEAVVAAEEETVAEELPDGLIEEAPAETEEAETTTAAATGPIVIEEPEKEPLVYPEGAGGEVTEAEAELMARMEDMSPEEAFAAWEAMLAETEVLEEEAVESEEAAVPAEEEAIAEAEELPDWLIEEASTEVEEAEAEADLMARMEDMSPEEAFAAWEAMLAEGEAIEEETPAPAVDAEAEEAWMALIEDAPLEEAEELAPAETEVQEELPEDVVSVQAAEEVEQPWMTLAEDETLREAAVEAEEPEEVPAEEVIPEADLPEWATAEALDKVPETAKAEEEIQLGPDVVLLSEEEETEIRVAQEPEEPSPETEVPTVEAVIQVAETPAAQVEEPEQPPEATAEAAPVPEIEVIEPEDDQGHLELARQLWTAGQNAEARAEYEDLLKSPLRKEVIVDLERITSEQTTDEATLRLLGDAYMKDNRLEEALSTYRRALSKL
jgi:hypothetical protein